MDYWLLPVNYLFLKTIPSWKPISIPTAKCVSKINYWFNW